MRARPHVWGPLLWTVLVALLAFALVRLPVDVAYVLSILSALGLVALSEDRVRDKARRIREALSILQIPVTKAATHHMAWDAREFERALAGERKLDEWRLEMLGPEFQRVLAVLTLRDLGFPAIVSTALKIEPAIAQMKESA